jgi:MFS family permease
VTSQGTQKADSDSAKEKGEEKEEGEGNMAEKSRWWDHYYVRYFVGSVFAVPLMLALSKAVALKPLVDDDTGDSKLLNATVLGAAGLAFCYVASAPILLLHATRAHRSKANRAGTSVGWGTILFAIGTMALAIALGGWIVHDVARPIENPTWLCFVPFVAVVVTQGVLILRTPTAAIVEFYRHLAMERAHDPEEELGRKRKEYIQSYRDMREHGNALLILVMEGVLTAALLQACSLGILLAMLVLWVMPAALVWFVATDLEAHLDQVK